MKKYSYNSNCFDAIRLFAALQVLYFHFIEHFQIVTSDTILEKIFCSFSGVIIFFAISAFLITASYERSKDVYQYIKKRFFRIYPALWFSVLLSWLSIVLLYREKSGGGYIKWLIASVTCAQFYTPDFLRGYGVGAPNGSLWTICIEIQAYIVIALSYKRIKNMSNKCRCFLILCCMFLSYLGGYFAQDMPGIIYKLFKVTVIPYLYIFIIGMTIYFGKENIIPLLSKYWYIAFMIFALIYIGSRTVRVLGYGVYYSTFAGCALVLLTYCIAFKFSIRISFDISYGIYLYHMVIVNIFIELEKFGTLVAFLCLIITVGISIFSYYVIEKPCINLKNRN